MAPRLQIAGLSFFSLDLNDVGRADAGAQAAGHTVVAAVVVKTDGLDMSPEIGEHGQLLAGVLDGDDALEQPLKGDPQTDDQALGPDQDLPNVFSEGLEEIPS